MRISTISQNHRIDASIRKIQREMADAQSQISTGKRAQVYSGLSASDSRMSINLRADLEQRDSLSKSIKTSTTRMAAMDHSLTNIQSVISNFRTDLITHQNSMSENPTGDLKKLAENAIAVMTDLINTKVDGRFLFNGFDSNSCCVERASFSCRC